MTSDFKYYLEQIGKEKGIEMPVMIQTVQNAVLTAAKKRLHMENLEAVFDEKTGEVNVFTIKTVVEKVTDESTEIGLKEAKKILPSAQPGDTLNEPVPQSKLGRTVAQNARQLILQKILEAERDNIYAEFASRKNEILTGIVDRKEHGDIILDLGRAEGVLPHQEQCFREHFDRGDHIKVFLFDIKKAGKGPRLLVSRTHPGLLAKLFELEVPEIAEGKVTVITAARENSGRSKIAVRSNHRDVDPVGACVGYRGIRVQSVVNELQGEKVDIVLWSEDIAKFAANALSPAKISKIIVHDDNRVIDVIVPDDQLSVAVGKKGVNVRLAVKLTRWDIDVYRESEYGKTGPRKKTPSAASGAVTGNISAGSGTVTGA